MPELQHDVNQLFIAFKRIEQSKSNPVKYITKDTPCRPIEADLIDQLFNASAKRLARVLLLLAHFGKDGQEEPVMPRISQETLAEMIGPTRSRVSFFLNKFRKLGFIDYNGDLHVHSSLLNVALHD